MQVAATNSRGGLKLRSDVGGGRWSQKDSRFLMVRELAAPTREFRKRTFVSDANGSIRVVDEPGGFT